MANEAGIQELSDNGSDGTRIGKSSSIKVGMYGAAPVVQAATIADATSAVTTTSFNALLLAMENIGILASS